MFHFLQEMERGKEEHEEERDRYSVCIERSKHQESIERAVQSILEIKEHVGQIIFVGKEINHETIGIGYKDWKKHCKELEKGKIDIVYQEVFDVSEVTFPLLLNVPSLTRIHHSKIQFTKKLEPLKKRIAHFQRFAFEPLLDLTLGGGSASLWYLVLCLFYCVDWWRHLFAWFTFHGGLHVRLTEVLRGYKRAKLADERSSWLSCCGFGWFGDRAPLEDGGSICITGPGSGLTGRSFFLYWMDQRTTKGWRGWFFVCVVFYFCAGFPIWPRLIRAGFEAVWRFRASATSTDAAGKLGQLLDTLENLQLLVMVALVIVHAIVIYIHFRWAKGYRTNQLLTIIAAALFPFVIPIAIPFVLWYARFDRAFFAYTRTLDPALEETEGEFE